MLGVPQNPRFLPHIPTRERVRAVLRDALRRSRMEALREKALRAAVIVGASSAVITPPPPSPYVITPSKTAMLTVLAAARGRTSTPAVSVPAADYTWTAESYANTTALVADKGSQGAAAFENDDTQPGQIVLDTSASLGAAGLTALGLTKAMRYDYVGGVACSSYTIRRNLWIPVDQTEVWAEFYLAFSSSWATYPSYMAGSCAPGYNPDFKLLFGRMAGGSNPDPGRFEVLWGNSTGSNIVTGYPGNEPAFQLGNSSLVTTRRDGNFFRLRVNWKYVSGGSGAKVRLWVDNTKVADKVDGVGGVSMSDMAANGGYIRSFALCANRDPRPETDQSMWWARVKVWYAGNDPGWT